MQLHHRLVSILRRVRQDVATLLDTRVTGTPYLIIVVSYVWCPRNPGSSGTASRSAR